MDYRQTALELIQGRLPDGSQVRLRVTSASMAPMLLAGDVVVLQPVPPERLRRGDLVAYLPGGEGNIPQIPVTHRLLGCEGQDWRLKGDANLLPDPPLSTAAILGLVVALERDGAHIGLQSPRWQIANRCLGWISAREAGLFGWALRLERRRFPSGAGSAPGGPRVAGQSLARLGHIPFRLLQSLVLRLGMGGPA